MHGADESMENAHAEKTDLVFYVRHPCRQSVPCGEVLLRLQREIFFELNSYVKLPSNSLS